MVVYPDLYNENILIDKSITLTSLALFDTTTNTIIESLGDDWIDYSDIFLKWEVIDDNINSTIIDGSGELKSTITIATEEDLCIEPLILGFTIQDGSGTLMDRFYENGNVTIQQYMGGGILSYLANPILHYNKIQNNGGLQDVIKSGSAIYPASSSDDIDFIDRNTQRNSHCENTVFDFTHNFFENNTSSLGRHIGNRYFEGEFDLSNCVFDYWNCQEGGVYQTPIWVNIDDLDNLVAEDEENSGCLLTGDVYVDPITGNDDLNDGSEESPFYTITNTLPKVVGTENVPVNIYLADGTYSPSINGETFPIEMFSFVNLIGQGVDVTILNAMVAMDEATAVPSGGVIFMYNSKNNTISNLMITGGRAGNGGGIYLYASNPILTNLKIHGNRANTGGGGLYITNSNASLANVSISDNQVICPECSQGVYMEGGGIALINSTSLILNNVIINNNLVQKTGGGIAIRNSNCVINHGVVYGNVAEESGNGIWDVENSHTIMINTIVWNNNIQGQLNLEITYSNIQEGWDGEGNIASDPQFTDPENDDYNLHEDSPCIDSGDPNYWYNDLDGTRANIGSIEESLFFPSFTNYDYGAIGDINSTIYWSLYNFSENSMTLQSVSFDSDNFSVGIDFPITINPRTIGNIPITCLPQSMGNLVDNMLINSYDLPDSLAITLTALSVGGNILNGYLSGIIESASYQVTGDLTIAENDAVSIIAGTKLLFDGEYSFTVNGVINAIGTEIDSIIFDNLNIEGETNWKGLSLYNQSEESIFKYVRISGASKSHGGGVFLSNSNPIFNNVMISDNNATNFGGGMYLYYSNPIMNKIIINGNSALVAGGIYGKLCNIDLEYIDICNNVALSNGGGLLFSNSNLILSNLTIIDNISGGQGGGLFLAFTEVSGKHVTISNNIAEYGGGMYLYNEQDNDVLINSILWNNYPESIFGSNEHITITYSNIEGGWEGDGNIDADPLFTDPESGDYTLMEGSPCIDAGIVIEDMEYCGSAPDMGAYEYITEDCVECEAALADVNGDSQINILDLVQISYYILELSTPAYECAADYNGDGQVNILDLVQISNYILNP